MGGSSKGSLWTSNFFGRGQMNTIAGTVFSAKNDKDVDIYSTTQ